jgi:hypothetical protein
MAIGELARGIDWRSTSGVDNRRDASDGKDEKQAASESPAPAETRSQSLLPAQHEQIGKLHRLKALEFDLHQFSLSAIAYPFWRQN